eukprot:3991455-Pleurochrysis_carterae.AAC.1
MVTGRGAGFGKGGMRWRLVTGRERRRVGAGNRDAAACAGECTPPRGLGGVIISFWESRVR